MTTKLKAGLVVGIVIVLGAIVALFKGGSSNNSTTQSQPTADNSTSSSQTNTSDSGNTGATSSIPTAVTTPTASTYKDGTYSANGNYNSPGGPDSVSVTLTLKNDIVTSVDVTPNPGDRMSARYQDAFISGYKQYVIGKDISALSLSKVSGSSLTPIGFNDALTKIKAQAKA